MADAPDKPAPVSQTAWSRTAASGDAEPRSAVFFGNLSRASRGPRTRERTPKDTPHGDHALPVFVAELLALFHYFPAQGHLQIAEGELHSIGILAYDVASFEELRVLWRLYTDTDGKAGSAMLRVGPARTSSGLGWSFLVPTRAVIALMSPS